MAVITDIHFLEPASNILIFKGNAKQRNTIDLTDRNGTQNTFTAVFAVKSWFVKNGCWKVAKTWPWGLLFCVKGISQREEG